MRPRRYRTVILSTAFLAVAILFALGTLIDGPFDPDKVGSAAEWIAGIGGLTAVLAVIWSVETDRERHETDLIRAQLDERYAKARSVVLFVSDISDDEIRLDASNESGAAVWDIQITVRDDNGRVVVRFIHGGLVPGKLHQIRVELPPDSQLRTPRLELSFTDVYGDVWQRSPDHKVTVIEKRSELWRRVQQAGLDAVPSRETTVIE